MTTPNEQPRILVIHGPNLNMLGRREPDVYGTDTLEMIDTAILQRAKELQVSVTCFQSNHEGEIVEKIQSTLTSDHGLIINPAAFTHTSVAIRDALLLLEVPIVEVHLSNIYKREPFRHTSMIAPAATGQVSGLGPFGYILALEAIARLLKTDLRQK